MTIGSPPIPLTMRVSKRARRVSLRVSVLDGRVTLTRPTWLAAGEALDFARSRENWLRKQLSRQTDIIRVAHGCELPIEGRPVPVAATTRRGVRLLDNVLCAPETGTGRAIEAYLKTRARDRATIALDRFAQTLNRKPARLSLRDTRSRWGSCTADGGIMLSWRLVMAPAEILQYVAAHEVAHLVHLDHSPAFWSVVSDVFPGHRSASAWLKEHGPGLHRYRFRD